MYIKIIYIIYQKVFNPEPKRANLYGSPSILSYHYVHNITYRKGGWSNEKGDKQNFAKPIRGKIEKLTCFFSLLFFGVESTLGNTQCKCALLCQMILVKKMMNWEGIFLPVLNNLTFKSILELYYLSISLCKKLLKPRLLYPILPTPWYLYFRW